MSAVIIVHGWNLDFKDDRRPSLGLLLALLFTVSFFLIEKRKEGKERGWERGRKEKNKIMNSPNPRWNLFSFIFYIFSKPLERPSLDIAHKKRSQI